MSDKKQAIPSLPTASNFAERMWTCYALQSIITQGEVLSKLQEQHGLEGTGALEAATIKMMSSLEEEAIISLINDMNKSSYITVGEV